ncbi:iron ABC transporter [Flavobacterium sediminis]|uniref:Iron ABC transporter n=1 Tax=Flavobacterium sediminis TaxID=2201181 RepID=A0A2U8QUI1_9FLAO|nr:iron ABC transporter permease [Flavobacterium sediminis]AWM13872.1 iron ABC transporter [Flavobacterium sediminis]
MESKKYFFLSAIIMLLVLLTATSLFVGVYEFEMPYSTLLKNTFFHKDRIPETDFYILYELRLPRIIMAILVGSALAVSGTSLQGMFKNPLATPDLIGITSGASLFAAISIVLGAHLKNLLPEVFHFSLISIMAFLGSVITMISVYKIATVKGKTNVVVMLLTGVAITALGFAFTGFMIYLSEDDELRDLTFWNLGSLAAANWTKNGILVCVITVSYFFILKKGKALNAMMLGENDAAHLGIPVERTKQQIIWFSSLLVGTSVAFCGTIGFIGLIVPYILRQLFKSNYQIILPFSAVTGSVLLLGADTLSRTIAAPSELPIGILTAIMGAPVFIAILIKNKKTL